MFLDQSARLFGGQQNPPLAFLTAAMAQVDFLDHIGPLCVAESTIARFEENVLAHGQRRSAIAGCALHWMRDRAALNSAFREELAKQAPSFFDHASQLESCWDARLKTAQPKSSQRKLTEEEQLEKGYVPSARSTSKTRWRDGHHSHTYYYIHVGVQWADYRRGLRQLERLIDSQMLEAFNDGRILACYKETGWTLEPPWAYKRFSRTPRFPRGTYFLFSRDIPKQWFPISTQLRGETRKRAIEKTKREIERRYQLQAPNHKGVKKDIVVKQVASALGYSVSLVTAAWKEADIPAWRMRGRRKQSR